MKYPHMIDLHMHTTVSDGTDSPEEILARVKKSGIDLFAVTDHDAIKGCAVLQDLLKEDDPRFITGVEFSCRDEEGLYHILGYRYDPDAEAIKDLVQYGHNLRMKKIRIRLDHLKTEFGISFPEEETEQLLAMDNPGKPHLANLMIKHGYVRSIEEAMEQYLNRLHVRVEFLEPERAISGILAGGGIPVLAHPSYGNGDQLILGEDMDRRIRRLMEFGLQGLEAFYSGFTLKLCNELLLFAKRYGLYVTAGSDYHGSNKMIELGDTGLKKGSYYPNDLRRFLEKVLN